MATVDAIVMGRNTFEQVLGFAAWPYGGTPVYVLNRLLSRLPARVPGPVTLHSAPPRELAALAWNRGHGRLHVDGGLTIQGFLREGLIDEITITVIPILLGGSRPLFGPLPHGLSLRHLGTRDYPFGFVQSRYALDSPAGQAGPRTPPRSLSWRSWTTWRCC